MPLIITPRLRDDLDYALLALVRGQARGVPIPAHLLRHLVLRKFLDRFEVALMRGRQVG